MIKVDKRYKIEFSYAGVKQEHYCHLDKEGNLLPSKLRISYFRGEKVSLDDCKTVEDVLDVIKTVAYGNRAKIVSINGMPLNYYHNKEHREYVDSLAVRLENHIKKEANAFFKEILEPFFVRNGWAVSTSHIGVPIVIGKDEDGEWDNISNGNEEFKDFNYLCYKFLLMVNDGDNQFNDFCTLQKYLDFKTYEKYYIEDVTQE